MTCGLETRKKEGDVEPGFLTDEEPEGIDE